MEQNKKQSNTGNYFWKYEELQQKFLTLLKIIAYIASSRLYQGHYQSPILLNLQLVHI